jgi:hypothetical protein
MARSELEQRRAELTRSLPGLSENRADTYRRNSDALALDRAGVKHERPEEMVRLGEAEVAMFNASFVTSTRRSNSGRALASGRGLDAPLAEHRPPGEYFARHAESG